MRQYRAKVSILGTILIALMLYASISVSAADHEIENHGYTTVYSNSTLEASIDPWTFGNLEIDDGESVKITFIGHYDDQRSFPQLYRANHYYNITVLYSETSTTKSTWLDYNSDGGDTGTREPNVQFNSVNAGYYLNVTLFAKVTLQGKSAQDSDEHSILLVDLV
jgi:hypothetical protein